MAGGNFEVDANSRNGEVEHLKAIGVEFQTTLNSLIQTIEQRQFDPSSFTHHRDIPEVVTRFRKEHQMSKGDLALLANVTANTLTKFYKDHSSMRVATLLGILEALGMTLYVGPIDE